MFTPSHHMITAHQIIVMLRKNLTPAAIHSSGGPVREVQHRILTNPDYTVRDMRTLVRILVEQKLFPFAPFWVEPIMGIYELEEFEDVTGIKRQYAALFEMARLLIDNAHLVAVDSATHKGALFFAGKYLANFATTTHGSFEKFRRKALLGSTLYFESLLAIMQNDRDPCSIIIKGIASSNIVVNHWNVTPPGHRRSLRMAKYVRGSGYLTWISQQMTTWPMNDRPAFNALGIASRFRLRRYYPVILTALELAQVGRSHKAISSFRDYPEFNHPDGDYDDFRLWESEQANKKT